LIESFIVNAIDSAANVNVKNIAPFVYVLFQAITTAIAVYVYDGFLF